MFRTLRDQVTRSLGPPQSALLVGGRSLRVCSVQRGFRGGCFREARQSPSTTPDTTLKIARADGRRLRNQRRSRRHGAAEQPSSCPERLGWGWAPSSRARRLRHTQGESRCPSSTTPGSTQHSNKPRDQAAPLATGCAPGLQTLLR